MCALLLRLVSNFGYDVVALVVAGDGANTNHPPGFALPELLLGLSTALLDAAVGTAGTDAVVDRRVLDEGWMRVG